MPSIIAGTMTFFRFALSLNSASGRLSTRHFDSLHLLVPFPLESTASEMQQFAVNLSQTFDDLSV